MNRNLRLIAAPVALALASAVPTLAGGADRRPIACGDTIMQDTRLTANLVDCPGAGLVIGADGITLDLGGHRIDGDGSGDDDGIHVEGRRGVTITNGTIQQFADGVFVVDGDQITLQRLTSTGHGHGGIHVARSAEVVIADNAVRGSGAGIIVGDSESVRVSGNRVSGSDSGGIPVFGSHDVRIAGNRVTTSRNGAAIGLFDGSRDNEATGNRLSRNAAGISLDNDASGNLLAGNAMARNDSGVILDAGSHDNRVIGNSIAGSSFEGIAVVGSDGNLIARNRVVRNGAAEPAGGIAVFPFPDDPAQTFDANVLEENAAIANGGDGIHVEAGQAANVVRANRADRNTELGINAAPGTIDGGGNVANGNGNPLECVGVVCGA